MEAEKWMSGSGLRVNLSKTELVVFHRYETSKSEIHVDNVTIKASQSMNVLGIKFDSRLTWDVQVDSAILKSRKALHAMRTIRKYFTETEMIKLVTSNIYSKLYYASMVWLLPNLKEKLFKRLGLHSGRILKVVDCNLSYNNLHKKFIRATPKIFSLYQTALNLYHVKKSNVPSSHAEKVNRVTLSERRNVRLSYVRNNNFKVGLNLIGNRLRSITNVIDKAWLGVDVESYKLYCKKRIIQESLRSL